jgi:hypothetical protein
LCSAFFPPSFFLRQRAKVFFAFVIFEDMEDNAAMTAACRTLAVSFFLLLSLPNTMQHTDYMEIPQPFTQDNLTIKRPLYGMPISAYTWFSTISRFLQTQGYARLFGSQACPLQIPSHSAAAHYLLQWFQAGPDFCCNFCLRQ